MGARKRTGKGGGEKSDSEDSPVKRKKTPPSSQPSEGGSSRLCSPATIVILILVASGAVLTHYYIGFDSVIDVVHSNVASLFPNEAADPGSSHSDSHDSEADVTGNGNFDPLPVPSDRDGNELLPSETLPTKSEKEQENEADGSNEFGEYDDELLEEEEEENDVENVNQKFEDEVLLEEAHQSERPEVSVENIDSREGEEKKIDALVDDVEQQEGNELKDELVDDHVGREAREAPKEEISDEEPTEKDGDRLDDLDDFEGEKEKIGDSLNDLEEDEILREATSSQPSDSVDDLVEEGDMKEDISPQQVDNVLNEDDNILKDNNENDKVPDEEIENMGKERHEDEIDTEEITDLEKSEPMVQEEDDESGKEEEKFEPIQLDIQVKGAATQTDEERDELMVEAVQEPSVNIEVEVHKLEILEPEVELESQAEIRELEPERDAKRQLEVELEKEPESEAEKDQEQEREPEENAEPDREPERDAEPEREPERDAEPDREPERDAESEREPERNAEPEREPERNAEPDREPERDAEPEREPERNAEPEREPERNADSKREPERDAEPEREPVSTDSDEDDFKEFDIEPEEESTPRDIKEDKTIPEARVKTQEEAQIDEEELDKNIDSENKEVKETPNEPEIVPAVVEEAQSDPVRKEDASKQSEETKEEESVEDEGAGENGKSGKGAGRAKREEKPFEDKTKLQYRHADITTEEELKIRVELDRANDLNEAGRTDDGLKRFQDIQKRYPKSGRAQFGIAQAYDVMSEQKQSNELLEKSIAQYEKVLAMPEILPGLFLKAGRRLADRQAFRGWGSKSQNTRRLLLDKFPDDISLWNEFGVGALMISRVEDARQAFQGVLDRDENNGFALVHMGFIVKTTDSQYEKAIPLLKRGIESDVPGVIDGRFFFHLGDAQYRIGNHSAAYETYELGAKKGLFRSTYQRSLYNVDHLTPRPWWTPEQTDNEDMLKMLQENWEIIRDEGISQLDELGAFKSEDENLREHGSWKQFTLYQQGRKVKKNCDKTPKTCALLDQFTDAVECKRGQIKYSVMHPGIHVWPHCGPTNCRIRSHLGLVVPEGPVIRVGAEKKNWTEGEFIIFDDSFEHEVWWTEGVQIGYRMVLIVDLWHPELTDHEKKTLSPI